MLLTVNLLQNTKMTTFTYIILVFFYVINISNNNCY